MNTWQNPPRTLDCGQNCSIVKWCSFVKKRCWLCFGCEGKRRKIGAGANRERLRLFRGPGFQYH